MTLAKPIIVQLSNKTLKFECLNVSGKYFSSNKSGFHTVNVLPFAVHEMTSSFAGFDTKFHVFLLLLLLLLFLLLFMVEKKLYEYCAPRVAYIFVSAKEEKKRRGKGTFFFWPGRW